MEYTIFIKWILWTFIYSLIGISMMAILVFIIDKMTSFSIKKEIVEDENVALGIMFGCGFIAIAIIIAAAII